MPWILWEYCRKLGLLQWAKDSFGPMAWTPVILSHEKAIYKGNVAWSLGDENNHHGYSHHLLQ